MTLVAGNITRRPPSPRGEGGIYFVARRHGSVGTPSIAAELRGPV
jgi:hypothetical protein